jgi:hypothetical protein
MMKYTNKDRLPLAPLLCGIDDSMVIAYLQGYMGEAFVKSIDDMEAVVVISGEYSFWGGDSASSDANHLIEHFFEAAPTESSIAIFAECNAGWRSALLSQNRNHPVAVSRYHIAQRDYDFDISRLQSYRDSLPKGFELQPFDMNIYRAAMSDEWSREFCETFDSGDDYLKRGFGFAAIYEGQFVSGASTMTVYDGGTEIQVATREDYRKKRLAIPCAAAMILECVRRKMRPHWDAANEISKKMAIKLGYEYTGEYTTIHLRR